MSASCSSPDRSSATAGYGTPFGCRRPLSRRRGAPPRATIRSIVRLGGGSTPSLRSSQAIASAPTCTHGLATSRSRTASTSASASAGVREGAREPPPNRLPTQLRLRLHRHPAPLPARKQRASVPARTAQGKRNADGSETAEVNETLAVRGKRNRGGRQVVPIRDSVHVFPYIGTRTAPNTAQAAAMYQRSGSPLVPPPCFPTFPSCCQWGSRRLAMSTERPGLRPISW